MYTKNNSHRLSGHGQGKAASISCASVRKLDNVHESETCGWGLGGQWEFFGRGPGPAFYFDDAPLHKVATLPPALFSTQPAFAFVFFHVPAFAGGKRIS